MEGFLKCYDNAEKLDVLSLKIKSWYDTFNQLVFEILSADIVTSTAVLTCTQPLFNHLYTYILL